MMNYRLDLRFMVRLHMRPGGYHSVRSTPKGEGAGEAFFIGQIK